MQGRILNGVAALGACAVAACCIVPSLSEGAQAKRGGNHGCNPIDGYIYSDHFFDAGDNISFGHQTDDGPSFPRRGTDDDLASSNTSSAGGPAAVNSCGAPQGTYTSVHASLGAGDDSVRLDAKGVPPDEDGAFGGIPKFIDSLLKGGGGDDTIRGHKGFDDIRSGSGADVIKADDGRADNVNCGRGQDKANVDSKDDVSGCEKKT
jgi:hypothetical protein